ncbi:SigE family RNA polymerase sigma factor [Blastococcus montanus]|uniref:SigE family RNA polymerase sigma factor n=1 Tax=Blastococcus montanus TaxID=3144973 RepID=UPI00320918D9
MKEQRDDEFTAFVAERGAALLRTACLITGDRQHGKDLVQTTLANAYGAWEKVRRSDHPPAYVRRIMVTSHLSWRRRLLNTEQVIERMPDSWTDDHQTAQADTDEMRRALMELSPRVRTAVVLRYFEDLSEAGTAPVMGCSVSTVNNHVTKGLAALRVLLAPGHGDLTPTTGRLQ